MGSHHKKKKKTNDVNVIISDLKSDQDLDSTRTALQPTFEGTTYLVSSRSMIDFCNVTDATGPTQSPS